MNESAERRFIRIISGDARGVGPSLARGGLSVVEPLYRGVTLLRNVAFDLGVQRIHQVSRPVISVGNLTTGGTGKTPVVAWLVDHLRRRLGSEIGILIRGYKSRGGASDEAKLLELLLADPEAPAARLFVGADRVAGAHSALRQHPNIAAFVMDDGFQHRRLHRDFDLVLIDATNPFGFEHVLPRGLLREGVRGLRRAHAVLVTRVDQVTPKVSVTLRERIAKLNSTAPIFSCAHVLSAFRQAGMPRTAVEQFHGRRVVAFAGIANPGSFADSLARAGCTMLGSLWFPDHHHYSTADLARIAALRSERRAEAIVTTAKDATKISDGGPLAGAPLFVAELEIQFNGRDAEDLCSLIYEKTRSRGVAAIEPSRATVLKKLRDCFPDSAIAADALALLDTYSGDSEAGKSRMQLAILKQCHGDVRLIHQLLELAQRDFRDVLVGAEYPRQFAAPLNSPPALVAELERQDRDEYEAWLGSDRP